MRDPLAELKPRRSCLPELLAPAGDPEKLAAAIRYGADAVYLAGPAMGLRSGCGNFDAAQLKAAVKLAHSQGVKVYVTVNVLAWPEDFSLAFARYLRYLQAAGADAVIVSDPGVFTWVRRLCPELEIHISTQASVTNGWACRFWAQLGARRIVLARELSLDAIQQLRRQLPPQLELEAFVHGAMCMAYSGRCLLSNEYTGRRANHGDCAQPCRWEYQVHELKRPQQALTVSGDERGSYLFSSKDLCMLPYLPQLLAAGISSLKIEGRGKSAYYVAVVTRVYRAALDELARHPDSWSVRPEWLAELEATVHRPFGTGFYFASPQQDPGLAPETVAIKQKTVVAKVLDQVPAGISRPEHLPAKTLLLQQKNKFSSGDKLEAVLPRGPVIALDCLRLWQADGTAITSAPHPGMLVWAQWEGAAPPLGYWRRQGGNG
ncbi:MAG: U32 family peptidase [Oscillospiraceae bacterium]|nr:U32 family peptidase [Oscillospiraceae bacterium]